MAIQIQRTETGYSIDIPATVDVLKIQALIDDLEFFDILSRSKATDADIAALSKQAKANWSPSMKKRLAELDEFKDLF